MLEGNNAANVGLLGALAALSLNDSTLPFLGVPLNVVTVAALGSIVSFAWGEPVKDRKKLCAYALGSIFIATTGVAVLPAMLGWEWVSDNVQAPLAGLVAVGIRFIFPHLLPLIPELARKILRLPKKENTDV